MSRALSALLILCKKAVVSFSPLHGSDVLKGDDLRVGRQNAQRKKEETT